MATKVIKRVIVKHDYTSKPDKQLCYDLKVERSGFIPRSILLQKMARQGEINKLMVDYENNKLFGRDNSDLEQIFPVLNIKGLNRSELVKAVRDRSILFNEKFKSLNKVQIADAHLAHQVDYRKHNKDNVDDDSNAVKE